MMYSIIGSTDGKFLGGVVEYAEGILSTTFGFVPDQSPIQVDERVLRFYNSNYSIDVKEI